MPILKFDECDYDCYRRQTNRGFRAYCRKVDPKCGREPQTVRQPEKPSVSLTPSSNKLLQAHAEAEKIIGYLEPFPPPITSAQTIGPQHFHKYKPGYYNAIAIGDKYIGTKQFAIFKSFRPDLATRLLKLADKWPFRQADAEFPEYYDNIVKQTATEVEWKLVGIIPQKQATKQTFRKSLIKNNHTSTDLSRDGDAAVFVSCRTGQAAQVNARHIHIVIDKCPNARFFSGGPDYMMIAECNDTRVMATMPVKMKLKPEVQLALATILC